jgi:peptidoglycan/LPS O-acetylase OafA/YrhL
MAPKLYRIKSPALGLVVLGVFFCLPGIVADLLHRTDLFTDGLLHHNPLIRLPLFLSGMVLCMLFARAPKLKPQPLQLALLGVIVVVTVLGAVYLRIKGLQDYHFIKNGMYLPAALALVWLCASVPQSVGSKVKYWGARLGGASLPMFFLHVPLFQLFSKVEKLAAGYINATTSTTSLSSVIAAGQDVQQALIVYPLYLAPLVITCVVLQERFVVPMQARIRQYFLNGKTHSTTAEHVAIRTPATDLAEYSPMRRDAMK